MNLQNECWMSAAKNSAVSYRLMIDNMVSQLSDEEFRHRPAPSINSVAVILRHLGGNLTSRWTDYLTSDGEKTWRNRETEFDDWVGTRASLLQYFDDGWQLLLAALDESKDLDPHVEVTIRGERQTLADAITRSLTHISYHVGQIAIVSRMVHQGEWSWLTIAPGASDEHNLRTWGTAQSRGAMGQSSEKDPK